MWFRVILTLSSGLARLRSIIMVMSVYPYLCIIWTANSKINSIGEKEPLSQNKVYHRHQVEV